MTKMSDMNPFASLLESGRIQGRSNLDGHPGGPAAEHYAKQARKRINSAAKGKRAERDLANWLKAHGFPDARRYVRTGDFYAPDGGDLVLDGLHNLRLVVEVKHHAGKLTDAEVAAFGAKLPSQVRESRGTMGVLVERRDGVADPAHWWLYPQPMQFANLLVKDRRPREYGQWLGPPISVACRTTVGFFIRLLNDAGYTGTWGEDHD